MLSASQAISLQRQWDQRGSSLSILLTSGELGLLCKPKPSHPYACAQPHPSAYLPFLQLSLFFQPRFTGHIFLGAFFKASLDYNLLLNSLRYASPFADPVTALVTSFHNLPHLRPQHSKRDSQNTELCVFAELDPFTCIANRVRRLTPVVAKAFQSFQAKSGRSSETSMRWLCEWKLIWE